MLETLSPQEAMTLFRNGGAFFVDVRTEKEFLKRAIPGCPLVPLDKLEREGLLEHKNGYYHLTERGLDLSNYAMSLFLLD